VLGLALALGQGEFVELLLAHRLVHALGRTAELADARLAALGGERRTGGFLLTCGPGMMSAFLIDSCRCSETCELGPAFPESPSPGDGLATSAGGFTPRVSLPQSLATFESRRALHCGNRSARANTFQWRPRALCATPPLLHRDEKGALRAGAREPCARPRHCVSYFRQTLAKKRHEDFGCLAEPRPTRTRRG
jgi:hypothetical protein